MLFDLWNQISFQKTFLIIFQSPFSYPSVQPCVHALISSLSSNPASIHKSTILCVLNVVISSWVKKTYIRYGENIDIIYPRKLRDTSHGWLLEGLGMFNDWKSIRRTLRQKAICEKFYGGERQWICVIWCYKSMKYSVGRGRI